MLTSSINSELEDVYMHSTNSEAAAKSILEHGLYVFGDDLSDFSVPFRKIMTVQDIKEIMSYEYGGLSQNSKAEDYIVLFSMPKNEQRFRAIDEKEKEDANSFVEIRRNGMFAQQFEINKKVGKENILGYVDKGKRQVILNPTYQKEELKQVPPSNLEK